MTWGSFIYLAVIWLVILALSYLIVRWAWRDR